MKRTLILISALLAASCRQGFLAEPVDAVLAEGELTLRTEIVPVQEGTRTWLDSESGGSPLRVYWSDGDRINVNGQVSSALAVTPGEKVSDADFSLRSVEAPFRVVYPASLVQDDSYATDGSIGVRFPATQEWTEGSFASGAAALYGYAKSGRVSLHNLCAAIKVHVTCADDTPLDYAVLSCSNTQLSGDFSLNPQTGSLEPRGGSGAHSMKLLTEGVVLSSAGTDFYFTVPKGRYESGLTFSFVRQSDHRGMQLTWTPTDSLKAGFLYNFSQTVNYVPGSKEIESVEEWNEFAAAFNAEGDLSKYLFNGRTVRLGADLTAESLTKLGAKTGLPRFTYNFDGQGHIITRTAATGSLFYNLSENGKISNLTLKGELNGNGVVSALVDTLLAGATISGVTTSMTINSTPGTASSSSPSGLICVARGGSVSDCHNTGAITVTLDCSENNYTCQAAGLLGQVNAMTGPLTLNACSNSGPITVNAAKSNTSYGVNFAGLGGIVGWLRATGYPVLLEDCDNSAALTWNKADAAGAKKQTSMGGIVGIGAPINQSTIVSPSANNGMLITLRDCDNSGTVTCKALSNSASAESRQKVYIGGLAGSLQGQESTPVVIDNCTSTGRIIPYDITSDAPYFDATASTRCGYCQVIGGISGWSGYIFVRNGTTVNCVLGNGDANRQVTALAGAFGFAIGPFSLENSSLFFRGYFNRLAGYKMNRAVVAVVPVAYNSDAMEIAPNITGSVITDCRLGGLLYTNTDTFPDSATTALDCPTAVFNSESKTRDNLVCGQGYTSASTDVTVSGYTYWNGIN